MAIIEWVGQAQAVPNQYQLTVTGSTAGTAYGFNGNERQVRYTAVTGDTTTTVAAGIVTAAQQSTDQRVREITVTVNSADATKIDVVGASNGRPITSFGVTTGVSSSTVNAGTGPNHLGNILNYSSGGLPTNADTLRFTGLTRTDGPQFELDALSAVTLALVDRQPDYLGVIGLPYTAPGGYTEFRNRFAQLKAADHLLRFGGGETDGACCINGGAVASDVIVAGSGAQQNVYPVHLHGFPTGSSLEVNGIGVSTAPDLGQTAVFNDAGVNALNGAVLRLSQRTTLGAAVFDGSSALVDCAYASLTLRGASAVLGGVNASCSTGTGIACTLEAGSLDWRAAVVPAAEVVIGTDASVSVVNAVGVMPTWIAHMYERSTLDDSTARITMPQVTNFVHCSPQNVTIRRKEHIKATWDTL